MMLVNLSVHPFVRCGLAWHDRARLDGAQPGLCLRCSLWMHPERAFVADSMLHENYAGMSLHANIA